MQNSLEIGRSEWIYEDYKPCPLCAKMIIQAGIKNVYLRVEKGVGEYKVVPAEKLLMGKDRMRRNDREITDKDLIEQFIKKEQIIRIAFYDNGDLYIVPLNYGCVYENEKYIFYFHGAKAGRKYELSKDSPNVGFEIDGAYELLEADIACDYSAKFQSVIGTGRLSIIEDYEEKIKGLNALMNGISGKSEWDYSKDMVEAVAVFRLEVDKLSCKAK